MVGLGIAMTVLIGLVFSTVGLLALRTERRRAADGVLTEGVVVGHERRRRASACRCAPTPPTPRCRRSWPAPWPGCCSRPSLSALGLLALVGAAVVGLSAL